MTGIHDFIIELREDFSETFTTEKGLELYANKDISPERLSNRIAIVINTPLLHETVIKKGYQVMIDPSILYKQIYRGVKQDSIHLIDKEKGLYKLDPKEIILYRANENEQWKGYLNNNLVEPIKKVKEKLVSTILFIPDVNSETFEEGKAKALFMNENIDAKKGDELAVNKNGGLPYWIDGKELWWLRNIDIYAVV